MNRIWTVSIVACTATGSERITYAIVGRDVHRTSAARRFGSVSEAYEYAERHGYTVTGLPR